MFGIRRPWRFRHLIAAWLTYWGALVVAKLGGAIMAAWYLSGVPENHATISAGFNEAVIHLTMLHDQTPIWTGQASIAEIVVWVAGPPLILWGVWLTGASRGRVGAAEGSGELGAGSIVEQSARERAKVRETQV